MDTNVTIGCVVLAAAVGLLTALTAWCRRQINRIARHGYGTAREINRGPRA
jgi:hypothetical protein